MLRSVASWSGAQPLQAVLGVSSGSLSRMAGGAFARSCASAAAEEEPKKGPAPRPAKLQITPYRRMLQLERKKLTELRNWALEEHQKDTLVATFRKRIDFHQRRLEWKHRTEVKQQDKKERLRKHELVLSKQLVFREKVRQVSNAKRLAMKRAKTLAKQEFLDALKEDVELWEVYPTEMQDRRYRLLRESRPYYTRFN